MRRYVPVLGHTPPSVSRLLLRESIYRLLPQTTPDNVSKNFEQYSIDPATRYPNLNASYVRPHQVSHANAAAPLWEGGAEYLPPPPLLLQRAPSTSLQLLSAFSQHFMDVFPSSRFRCAICSSALSWAPVTWGGEDPPAGLGTRSNEVTIDNRSHFCSIPEASKAKYYHYFDREDYFCLHGTVY